MRENSFTAMPKVLVADDSDLDLLLTERAIRRALPDWEVETAFDGDEALHKFVLGECPSLVLLDFRMPGKGAMEILEEIPKAIRAKVPFVLFSSAVNPRDVEACLTRGLRTYVEKPTDPVAYSQTVTAICAEWAKALSWD